MELFVQNKIFIYLIPLWGIISLLFWKKSSVSISSKGKMFLGLCHLLVILLISLSIADISLVLRKTVTFNYKTVFVVDVSDSVSYQAVLETLPQIQKSLDSARGNSSLAVDVLLFNSEMKVLSGNLSLDTISSEIDSMRTTGQGSDLSGAILRAEGLIPQNSKGSIVVISDGVNTGGSLEKSMAGAVARKIPVFFTSVKGVPEDPFMVSRLTLPLKVFVNERYPVEVFISSESEGNVELSLFSDDRRIAHERFKVSRGTTRWNHHAIETTTGQHRYKVTVKPLDISGDIHTANNTQIGAVIAETVPRILIVTTDGARIAAFVKSLALAGLNAKVISPKEFPFSVTTLLQYSAIIFENVPSNQLSLRQLKYVKSYVKDYGGGFLMTGGKNSFGSGGYSDSDIEDITPVLMSPQTYSSSFGLILLLDSSGSMRGYPIDWVKRAAKQIVWLMRGRYLGIYHFNDRAHVAVPLQKVERNRLSVDQDIDSIKAEGSTAFSEALRLAAQHLDERGFSSKHVILLSDGNPSDVTLLDPLYPLLEQAQIKVSTIGIGHQVNNAILKLIADKCYGKFYHSTEFDRIPQIFEQEIIRVIGPPFVEEVVLPRVTVQNGNLKNISANQIPRLQGYGGTTLKKGAVGELMSPRNDVLYGYWQCGLGKTAVFTSTAVYGEWSKNWSSWKGLSSFWGGIVKSVLRTRTSDYQINAKTVGSQSHIFIDAIDGSGNYINDAQLSLWVVEPGTSRAVHHKVKQVGLGHYSVSFTMKKQGFYNISLSREKDTGRKEEVATSVLAMAFAPEFSAQKPSLDYIGKIMFRSGGKILNRVSDFDLIKSYESKLVKDVSHFPLWQWFALGAFLFYVLEISLRRLNVFAREEKDAGSSEETAQYKRIADNFMKMARDFDTAGNHEEAQKFYLKARTFYIKAEHNDKAARMWDRYRHLDHSRGGA